MDVLKIIASALLVIAGALLVVCVMMQEGNDEGMSSIMGSSNTESEFGKSGSSKSKKLNKYTKILAAVVMALALVIAILTKVA
ncbi:MAG: preprotein translocase subunit SecG [Eubacteriales bacterium]|nr:preprotein translocase subunit SecG [Eubacteriales bacterium]